MLKVTKTEAIKNVLLNLTHRDLADLYNFNMECQINVAQDDGERIEGEFKGKRWHGWTDGLTTWKPFRVPWNAATQPEYEDSEIRFDLAKHADGIGMTGWDWVDKVSRWVAFDFDSLMSHQSGLPNEELKLIEEKASEVPWITVRKSTSGNGIHFYVFLDPPIKTVNHNEHASLARAILGQLAALTGFDFVNKVDICGGNMWVWHRKMKGTDGLKLLKKGVPLTEVPPNWKDHVKVIAGRRRKLLPQDIEQQAETISEVDKLFAELTGQYVKEQLDQDHKKLIEYLRENNCLWWWDQDNNMLVTHTFHLKEAHESLSCKGIFNTVSTGKEHGRDHNCFLYPLRRGGWVVRRFTPGVREHDSWDQDSSGWTRCFYNIEPSLPSLARNYEGVEHPGGGYVFQEAELAQKAVLTLGAHLDLPPWALGRSTKIKEHKDGRLIVEVSKENEDNPGKMKGWIPERGKWKRIFSVKVTGSPEQDARNFDDYIRHLVTEQNEDCGWVIKSDNVWVQEPVTHIKYALRSLNLTDKDVVNVLGDNIFKHWTIVNKPFQPEYPGDRQWNRKACQLMFYPSKGDNLNYPTWMKILSHVGETLTPALGPVPWAKDNGIVTGADYLKCWIASLFQAPMEPLPYIFLFGPESSGKSIFHEALSLLITSSGYQRAENALISQSGFNAELINSLICVVEEMNLSQSNRTPYARIKDWVTSHKIPIHQKGVTPYLARNTTHWIQCSNDIGACPVFPGDTRITMIYVGPIEEGKWENKKNLIAKLKKEASDFLGEVTRLEIPESTDRLNVPVIATSEKNLAQKQNQSALEQFIEENCFYAPGYAIKLSDFYEQFMRWLDPTEAGNWTKNAIGKNLMLPFVKGRWKESQHYIGNISFTEPKDKRKDYTVLNGKLVAKVLVAKVDYD
jgi:hypothetical protein